MDTTKQNEIKYKGVGFKPMGASGIAQITSLVCAHEKLGGMLKNGVISGLVIWDVLFISSSISASTCNSSDFR